MFKAKGEECIQLLTYTFSEDLLKAYQFEVWFAVLSVEDVPATEKFVRRHVETHSHLDLPYVKDKQKRSAYDMATAAHKGIFQDLLLWFGRYRVTESRPEHMSATCFVYKAIDEKDVDNEGQQLAVALKLMLKKDQFKRELTARHMNFSSDHVMDVLRTHPDTGTDMSSVDSYPDDISLTIERNGLLLTKAQAEQLLCIVMPLADRNLFVAVKQERFAGRNMEEVRHIFLQICHCVKGMHSKGVAHADIKPLNIVRMGTSWKLIDLDAAAKIGVDPVGFKSSTAYMPPESFDLELLKVRQFDGDNPLVAAESFDVWSLGCILYQLVNKDTLTLFMASGDDNLSDSSDLMDLVNWYNFTKSSKLRKIDDLAAKNLVSRMLSKDPAKRPSLEAVIIHPFISKKSVVRMIGDKPLFDVFLSYRVKSDLGYVEKLYEMLTRRGLKVWWDKKCLQPGEPWENGFCGGVMNSSAFVCVLSKGAINDESSGEVRNYWALSADSGCDFVLLEHRLAVELKDMDVISKVCIEFKFKL
jgi:serine/threonine protein kinase